MCHKTDETLILAQDSFVQGLELERNNMIFYLPIKIAESFPNLLALSAWDCSLKEISRKNFENLSKLKQLILYRNEIETIFYDTFADLIALEYLNLRKKNSTDSVFNLLFLILCFYRVKQNNFLNGNAFTSLKLF